MSNDGMSDADVFNALEGLGEALFVLSGRLKSARFLDDDVNYSFYEHVVARHAKADRYTRDYMAAAEARLDADERERDALREALRPFADAADIADGRILARYGDTDFPDATTVAVALNITLGHIRAARAALTANHSAPVVEE